MMKYLTLALLVSCASCKKPARSLDICSIDVVAAIANCAHADEKYTVSFPDAMMFWIAFPRESLLLLANRLETCEIDGKLPPDDNTIGEMHTCPILPGGCGELSFPELQGYFAVSGEGFDKIKAKIEFCKRH